MFSDPERSIEQFGLGKGNYVADFGAGYGYFSFAAAEAVGETGRIYAIDVQKDLLTRLKNEARNVKHLLNIDIIWANLDHLGSTRLRENSIDAVILANILFQLPKKDDTCLEIKRILRSTGRILVIDWSNSIGGVSSKASDVFTRDQAIKLFFNHGFVEDREIDAGAGHYGIIFKRKN
jgi:ubiquinone/menaquinone biosynthesis C-methylase UbiE